MRLSVITPHADRPAALSLCQRWMRKQTRRADEWILADGGQQRAVCLWNDVHVHDPRPTGPENFAGNIVNGLQHVTGELVAIVEDDDWYAPTYLERAVAMLEDADLVGSSCQRYYHVQHRCWRVFKNRGASLCQTAFRRELVPLLLEVARECMADGTYGIDGAFWARAAKAGYRLKNPSMPDGVVGIKGLPGSPGLGIGHRPNLTDKWVVDEDSRVLREWVGSDADLYLAVEAARP